MSASQLTTRRHSLCSSLRCGTCKAGQSHPSEPLATHREAPLTPYRAIFDQWSSDPKWGQSFPSAVAVIEKDFDALLRFFQFDPTYWTVLRTTNPIERLNKEFKRRTRAMEVTGGEISTYRCLVYVAQTMEHRWSFHPLSQWTFIYTQNAA